MRATEWSYIAGRVLVAVLIASGVLAGAVVPPPPAGAQRSERPPKLIQLSYDESSGDIGPDRQLAAFARRTNSLRFATSYNEHRASAPGKYRPNITDTDIHGEEASHPWIPDRDHGGRRVVRLVHRSLFHRGFAKVSVHARSDDLVDAVRVRIDRSDCASDPPLYPVSCEVRVS